ncbi:PREDICTED: histone-lysine N-methyltransferase SETMAR-like [Dufourea novaeangliae]|uniref:histone-lysine N-methyltransferase SETMAR-like n=1 Tax=Dufourea novaeangliae TaxID=178035 RepID=UPI000767B738|nr:PREDICTED: histone-lysine N-methyltransferase SETMAR-like [Dufourea novaeangliae]
MVTISILIYMLLTVLLKAASVRILEEKPRLPVQTNLLARKKAAEAHKEICEVYGVDCITDRTCQNWFKKFRSGDFSLKDDQRSGRPTEVDDDQIKAIIEEDRHITVRGIAERLNVSHTTIVNNLKRNEADPFLKRIITGDEKWVMYSNIIRKRSWSKRDEPAQSTSKAELHQKKVMLSIWWDYKGVVYFELLPRNQTINSDVYCQQLLKLDEAIKEKRPELANRKGIVFHHDNARPHTSLVTRGKLLELGWEVM